MHRCLELIQLRHSVVKRLLGGEDVTVADSGLSPREWRELMTDLGREG